MIIPHIKDYEKLDTPNAKMLALRKAIEFIKEEEYKVLSECVSCRCGFLMSHEYFNKHSTIYINPNGKEVEWVDCPCCGGQIYKEMVGRK